MSKVNWSLRLVNSLNDPNNHIISTNAGVVIKDKYPKSKHHYLVLPRDDIPSIYHLEKSHLDLLSELHLLAINVIEVKNLRKDDFNIGFHALPSMQRLHLHVISRDFISPCLKTKKHWNSFNTKLFIFYDELVDCLRTKGKVQKMNIGIVKELGHTKLQCNQCNYHPKTLLDLKDHLLTHLN